MIDTYINLIVNLEYGWDKYFLNYIVPLKKEYPEEFPYILITFSNHPHWTRDNYPKLIKLLQNGSFKTVLASSKSLKDH